MITERVDDISLIMAELQKSNPASLLTQPMPDHGNWQGADKRNSCRYIFDIRAF